MLSSSLMIILIIVDLTVLFFFILSLFFIFKRREKTSFKLYRDKAKLEQNQVVDILIDNLRIPTLLLSKKGKILAYNEEFRTNIVNGGVTNFVLENSNIQEFVQSKILNKRKEIKIGSNVYYVDFERIKSDKFNRILITYLDVTDLKVMYEKQENFILDIKHEIKTPITAILGLSELLSSHRVEKQEDVDKILKTINSEVRRLDGLIDNLTSTIESNINLQLTNMNEVFDDLRLIYLNKNSDVTITFDNYVEHEFICDSRIIKQIIINLVDNSLKFTSEGYIKVTSFNDDETIKIAIVDTGIGISKEEQDLIFERFYRTDKSRDRNTGGFGLGLSIVKTLLVKLDGSIEIDSNEGVGTTFTIKLPQK